jgi:cell division septum initiation protein DivIVA
MRLRLLRRRLTVSSPRMAIRSTTPWPLRWLLAALVLGFSGAIALWAFDFGKEIAGLDRNATQELERLRSEVEQLKHDLGKAQSIANTSESLLTAEKSAQEQLMLQIRLLQADNQTLRTDLGFFERLIPGSGSDALSIRGLQVDRVGESQLKWQVLMIQAEKNAPEFKGALEVTFTGTLDGKPWSALQAPQAQSVLIKGYLRQEGMVDVPSQAVVKTVTAKIFQGNAVKVLHTIKL